MIDIKDRNSEKEIKYGSYPSGYTKIGEFDEDFKIFINELILNDIKSYLSGDKSKELGGVLIGDVFLDESNRKFIVITEIIIADFTEANLTRLTFTHKTWEDINRRMENDFPGKSILGWFHSHPGHTVFMSNYDKFIHENFFSGEFYIAYVFDPVNNDEGFFFWREKKLVKAESYFIYNNLKSNSDNNISQIKETNVEKKTKKSNPLLIISLAISIFCLIITSVLTIKYFELDNQLNSTNDFDLKLKELKEENRKTNNRIDTLVKNLESNINTNETQVSQNTIKYQIKPGDTLRKIALFYFNDEGKYNLLIRFNNLKDENDITVGQVIEIPAE